MIEIMKAAGSQGVSNNNSCKLHSNWFVWVAKDGVFQTGLVVLVCRKFGRSCREAAINFTVMEKESQSASIYQAL